MNERFELSRRNSFEKQLWRKFVLWTISILTKPILIVYTKPYLFVNISKISKIKNYYINLIQLQSYNSKHQDPNPNIIKSKYKNIRVLNSGIE